MGPSGACGALGPWELWVPGVLWGLESPGGRKTLGIPKALAGLGPWRALGYLGVSGHWEFWVPGILRRFGVRSKHIWSGPNNPALKNTVQKHGPRKHTHKFQGSKNMVQSQIISNLGSKNMVPKTPPD